MKKKKACYIVGAGDFYGFNSLPEACDFIIAADGGYVQLKKHDIIPNILIGDFDSLSFPGIEYLKKEYIKIIRLPKEKDETDMLAAIKIGLDEECDEFHIYGGTGGRFEHTYANLQCLAYLIKNNAHGFIYGNECVITAICNENISFDSSRSGFVSIFAYSETVRGVSIKGLKYELNRVTLTNSNPIGISNEFIGKNSIISVEDGILLVIYPI